VSETKVQEFEIPKDAPVEAIVERKTDPSEQKKVWDKKQVSLIANTVAKGASPDELRMFLWVCSKHKLDPFTRQVHFVRRKDRKTNEYIGTIQVGIDGYRSIAARSPQYAGQSEPEYELDEHGKVLACRIRVYRKDFEQPTVGIAYWDEYRPYDMDRPEAFMWKKMPRLMLAKCSEALALRRAFPELADMYVDAELDNAVGSEPTGAIKRETALPPSTATNPASLPPRAIEAPETPTDAQDAEYHDSSEPLGKVELSWAGKPPYQSATMTMNYGKLDAEIRQIEYTRLCTELVNRGLHIHKSKPFTWTADAEKAGPAIEFLRARGYEIVE